MVRVASGAGDVPADLVGRLLKQLGQLQRHVLTPRGLTASGLTSRETEVFRMVADGMDTADIARELSYSERTVKNIVHAVTTRLQLRNRVARGRLRAARRAHLSGRAQPDASAAGCAVAAMMPSSVRQAPAAATFTARLDIGCDAMRCHRASAPSAASRIIASSASSARPSRLAAS